VAHDLSIIAYARLDGREDLIAKLPNATRTQDDRELILLAYETWGEDCVRHLLGDFAFVIRDKRSRQLFCARDHFGVKPFYYARVEDELLFSNSLNTIRRDPRVSDALNETAIGDYLLFGLNQDLSSTTFREIKRVPPAHTLTIRNGVTTLRRYWSPDTTTEVRFRDDHSYVDRFRELLRQAVRDRLRDAPRVAISMSGGLDSTSLAAVALDCGVDVHACAVVYDKLIPDEERQYATTAANHLGIPISYVVADQYSLFDEQVPGDMDQPEPFLLSPLTAQFHSLLRLCETHAQVAFTGYDGDAFMHEPRRSRLQVRTVMKRMIGKQAQPPVFPEWIDDEFAKRTNLRDRYSDFFAAQKHIKDAKKESRPAAIASLNSKVWAPLFEGYDPGATKLNLEVRHPFIDVRLVEYLLSIPRTPWCEHKHILRVAMKDLLPPTILNRRKTPLAGDPALQIARSTSVRWLDSFEVNPQLERFVNLKQRRSVADEVTPDDLWSSLRVFALNYWLTNSQTPEHGDDAWNVNRKPTDKATNRTHASPITSRK